MSDRAWPLPGPPSSARPRRPVRANGRQRYEALLDAAERLLQSGAELPLAIRDIARTAKVPMASVYHFLPGPAAVAVALAERHMEGLFACIGRPIPLRHRLGWRQIIALLQARAVSYYIAHPYAQRLLLGADHSWAIRQSDLANNRAIAGWIAEQLADKFPGVAPDVLVETLVVGIAIADAILALAIASDDGIDQRWGAEASLAGCAYVAAKIALAD